jgi:hypothetical protein
VNFAPLKMLAGDRARFCARLIAICLALVTGAALHGQSESTTTNLRSPSYGTAEVAGQTGFTPDPQPQNPYLGAVPAGKASAAERGFLMSVR